MDHLATSAEGFDPASLRGNIESLIGFARVPVGVIGPLRINGSAAHGDFYVPLATTEGALVASFQRGARLISESGGATVLCLTESVSRGPAFLFDSTLEAGRFLAHVLSHSENLQPIVDRVSKHARILDITPSLVGKEVFLLFQFTTGDAAGQNMVTLATDAISRHLISESPVAPRTWYVEANLSGDKKATHLSFQNSRGKRVVAEVVIARQLVTKILHAEPEAIVDYWETALLGSLQSGSIGMQGHVANGLAAIFLARGQDVACISEAAIGITRFDTTASGDLYLSLVLPSLIAGTVGGGTHLPTARECLEILGCYGDGGARKFAEICGATALAGELSIAGALAAGEFSAAHAYFGRPKGAAPPQ
ncbi:MAG: hydroxymethylglutaryl-CoA reductase [Acidobacteria bacterium]|nr:hydroxymethylglutaryl-CoA reductase [Acidobacteriota bacterium]